MASIITIELTNAGGNFTIDENNPPDVVYIVANGITLSNNVVVDFGGTPPDGTQTDFIVWPTACDLNGHTFSVTSKAYTQDELIHPSKIQYTFASAMLGGQFLYLPGFANTEVINGDSLIDNTTPLTKLEKGASAYTIVCDGTRNPQYVALSGDATLANTGALTIAAGAIDNSKVSASAAIALSKLAPLTASKPVVTNGSGVLTTASQITAAQGGTGQDTSASTGFATVSGGVWSVGAIADTVQLQVSFESGYTGDFKIKMPYAGTVTEIYAYATKAIAGTDNGTITPKNNAGTTMTSGTITFTASDARGTAYTSTPSANNTFIAGDILTFTTAKTTSGGVVQLSISVTRTS